MRELLTVEEGAVGRLLRHGQGAYLALVLLRRASALQNGGGGRVDGAVHPRYLDGWWNLRLGGYIIACATDLGLSQDQLCSRLRNREA